MYWCITIYDKAFDQQVVSCFSAGGLVFKLYLNSEQYNASIWV